MRRDDTERHSDRESDVEESSRDSPPRHERNSRTEEQADQSESEESFVGTLDDVSVSVHISDSLEQTSAPVDKQSLSTNPERQSTRVSVSNNKPTHHREDSVTTVSPSIENSDASTSDRGGNARVTLIDATLESVSVPTSTGRGTIENQRVHETVEPAQASVLEDPTISTTTKRPNKITDRVTHPVKLTQHIQSTGNKEVEIEQKDPMYQWYGGTPYALNTPQVIIHIENEQLDDLPFLQRILRDTYNELTQGEPRLVTVTSTGPTVDLPRVQGGIVTLDLTTEDWTVTVGVDDVSITHEAKSTNIVDIIHAATETMYGGGLGFLVINVAEDDVRPHLVQNGPQRFVKALLDVDDLSMESSDNGLFEIAGAPVRLAEPRIKTQEEFWPQVGSYLALDQPSQTRVADTESQQKRILARESWPRIALTARQDGIDGESAEHYRWKGAIAEGLARQLWVEYNALERRDDEEVPFQSFVNDELLLNSHLETEVQSDGESDEAFQPDICIDAEEVWIQEGIRNYLDFEDPHKTELLMEFETGRVEGAFNFRKLRETVEKYPADKDCWIGVIVPPRLLFRNRSRAELARQLVDRWPPDSSTSATATLCVPVLDSRGCCSLRRASDVIDEWFETEGDNE